MLVHVLPDGSTPFEMLDHWRAIKRRDKLIPWELAQIYFRPAQVWIDATQEPPVISSDEPM